MEILRVENLCKTYGKGEAKVNALKDVSFSLEKGGFAALMITHDNNLTVSVDRVFRVSDGILNGITEGEYPDTPNEIAISSSLKNTASVSLNGTVELYKPVGSAADYLVVGFLDDTETPCLISNDMSIAVMTPEGLYWCKTAIPIGIIFSIVIVWILSAAMRVINPGWFSSMPILGISWICIIASILLGLLTVLLAACSPAKRAAKVSPLTAVSGNAGQTASFRKAANTKTFKIETALGIHHAKAKKKNYILMTGAFVVCITLFLSFSTLVDFMENAFVPPVYTPELSIAGETNTCSIGNELLEQIRQNE